MKFIFMIEKLRFSLILTPIARNNNTEKILKNTDELSILNFFDFSNFKQAYYFLDLSSSNDVKV